MTEKSPNIPMPTFVSADFNFFIKEAGQVATQAGRRSHMAWPDMVDCIQSARIHVRNRTQTMLEKHPGREPFSPEVQERAALALADAAHGMIQLFNRAVNVQMAWPPDREPTTAELLTKEGSWQDTHGRWCHKDHDDQWRGEEEHEYLKRLRELKEGLSL